MMSKQAPSTESLGWAWVDREIWTDRMLAALGNGVQETKWFSLIDKVYRQSTLRAAWKQVRTNKGAMGVDGVSIKRFDVHAEQYLNELSNALKLGQYRPMAVRRVDIPKSDGKTRPLGIPTVKDRIVQTAVKRVIEPIFEQQFLSMSYGFRPKRSCKDALREVDHAIKEGYTHVVDADLAGYFDTIPHDRLMERVEDRISDGRLLKLLKMWLKQEVISDVSSWTPTKGSPQGAVISPLLANIYLHPLDEYLTELGFRMVRYADDFVILCRHPSEAQNALVAAKEWVERHGLSLHPDKTHIGDCRIKGQGFDFLGYHFEAGKRWVRKKSLKVLKDKIRENTHRTCGKSMRAIIDKLNPMLRGWFGYFKHAMQWTFSSLDGFIRRRLRAILRKQQKKPGQGRCYADQSKWPNKYFAAAGLFSLKEAWQTASQSR